MPVEPMAEADIAVIIPAFRSGDTIGRALDSIAHQSVAPREVLVVDDASGDDTTARACTALRDLENLMPGVRTELVALTTNQGPGGARNAGIERCGAEVLCFLDADDAYRDGYLEAVAEAMRDPGFDVLVCPRLSRSTGNRIPSSLPDAGLGEFDSGTGLRQIDDIQRLCTAHMFLNAGGSVIVRRSFLGEHRFTPERNMEDWLFFLRLMLEQSGRYLFLERPLVIHEHETLTSISRADLDACPPVPSILEYLEERAAGDPRSRLLARKLLSIWVFGSLRRLPMGLRWRFLYLHLTRIRTGFVANRYWVGILLVLTLGPGPTRILRRWKP